MSEIENAIVIVADRLGAGYLGCYGNTWLETPALNRLAARSLLMENMIADGVSLESAYHAYWQGVHALCTRDECQIDLTEHPCLPESLTDDGRRTVLITDHPDLAAHPLADSFAERVMLPPPSSDRPAARVDDTGAAALFAAAADRLQHVTPPFLLWLHAGAMDLAWDAPQALRDQFAGEEDLRPPDLVTPPSRRLPDRPDPDELVALSHSYAGQVALFDLCLAAFLDALELAGRADDTALVLTSPRGFPLGEHGAIGAAGDSLRGESIQVPCLLHVPNHPYGGQRVSTLAQPMDVCNTLHHLLGQPEEPLAWSRDLLQLTLDSAWERRAVFAVEQDRWAVRTPVWFYCQTAATKAELYVKPDDRWEVNEVSELCPDVCEAFASVVDEARRQAHEGVPSALPDLPDELVQVTRRDA